MNYEEFSAYELIINPKYPFVNRFVVSEQSDFYVESTFYTKMLRYADRYPDRIDDILNEIKATVKKYQRVVFCGDFEMPIVDEDGYIYREITDITNALAIFVDDISRGSDYGD